LKRRNKDGPEAGINDTIAAIATPTGSGGIGIIRISGPQSLPILKELFIPRKKNSKPTPFLLRYGRIVSHIDSVDLDEVLAAYMPEPNSFTGEDMVELYCHAGYFTLKNILDNILNLDARHAEAGEFSMRRFLNHGVDISRLEGAADIIAAKTDLAYRISREHLLGSYGRHISDIRKLLVHLLAEIEADIDFPDEDSVGNVGRELLERQLDRIISDLEQLSESYRAGKTVRDGYRVVLLGPPNSGKSSLFNRMVRQNRALVTPVPGTTRDYLSEWIDIDGLPVELYDTAGLREGRGRVEKAGIKETRKLIGRSDMIVYLFDLTGRIRELPDIKLSKDQDLVIALNKADLMIEKDPRIDKWQAAIGDKFDSHVISAKTGRGIKGLLKATYDRAGISDLTESRVVTSYRHKVKIDRALESLLKIRRMTSQPAEIISLELRQAADSIGEITGQIYTEEILDEIFSNFCIGK